MQKEIHLKNLLGSKRLKSTREREIILKELENRRDHFNAEKLYSVLNRKGMKGFKTHDLSNVKAPRKISSHRKIRYQKELLLL